MKKFEYFHGMVDKCLKILSQTRKELTFHSKWIWIESKSCTKEASVSCTIWEELWPSKRAMLSMCARDNSWLPMIELIISVPCIDLLFSMHFNVPECKPIVWYRHVFFFKEHLKLIWGYPAWVCLHCQDGIQSPQDHAAGKEHPLQPGYRWYPRPALWKCDYLS